MIEITDLKKSYLLFHSKVGMLKHLVGFARLDKDYDEIQSLKGINLTVPEGQVHGIIGMNGAGKSTLLKILTGVVDPTAGTFNLSGRVAALLELGTGFHGELSGRENVFLNGSMQGLSQSDITDRLPEIEAFAELGDFFDRPVKTYSSGMYVRLAFAFAVAIDPDVLIIDEALSVGDAYFQQKCLQRIHDFKRKGTTILFVSHDLGAVKALCDQVTVLAQGKVMYTGETMKALDLYNALLAEYKDTKLTAARLRQVEQSKSGETFGSGNLKMRIESVEIYDHQGTPSQAIVSGSPATIRVEATVNEEEVDNPTCGILIRDRLGYDVFGINSFDMGFHAGIVRRGEKVVFCFKMNADIGPGDYTLTAALHSFRTHVNDSYHWLDRAVVFQVLPSKDYHFIGVARLAPSLELSKSH